ncbi:hypothetical protein VVD49_10655 [Uliginosibacterium sp. H3]|uniref:Uncharacterized protein n=1 Tax=Uliginosibacterium silvisoli TaxID=3114758 RepID=A0ABU6K571_9RHOO|nr:hypothetical protein [Uliginosibacterium sp. H3]
MQSSNACTVQRGIFSLRTCGNASSEHCTQCMRPICMEHSHYGTEQILCPECFAASPGNRADTDEDGDAGDWESPGWSGRWSSEYNSSHAYVPLAAASQLDKPGQFDDIDRHAFATRSAGELDDGDSGGSSGFSDS